MLPIKITDLIRKFAAAGCFGLILSAAAKAQDLTIEPYEFESQSGETVSAERGELKVPLFHEDPSRGGTTVSFVRFPSTSENPGPPVIYLAGGPGGTGTGAARRQRFDLFMALRETGDVIAFNQRGTGPAADTPVCNYPESIEGPIVVNYEEFAGYYQRMAAYCNDFWAEQGTQVAAYTTWQSAGDLEALRRALGAEKLNLWGISYGTHLALAAMKRNPGSYDRVVLASAEGLGQTVKLPARSDAYFERVQAMVDAHPVLGARHPDFLEKLRGVIARLRAQPVTVTFTPRGASGPVTMTIDEFAVQLLMSFAFVSDPGRLAPLFQMTEAMHQGAFEPVLGILYQNFVLPVMQGESEMRLMPVAMDSASGISDERRALYETQAETALIGRALNVPFPALFGILDVPDLGPEFRAPFVSDIPTLVLSGTLDGRTFPEAHLEVMENLADGHLVILHNAGHNLFMIDPRIPEMVVDFFRGQEPETAEMTIALPDFSQ